MSACPSCFTERSAAGGCFCGDAPQPAKLKSTIETGKTATFEVTLDHIDEGLLELLLDEPMSDAEVVRTARSLLDAHGLTNIRIEWMNSVNRLGECEFFKAIGGNAPKAFRLRFSRKLFKHLTREEQMQTITHEVAHALTPGHHHDYVWAAKHRELGGDAKVHSSLPESVHKATNKWVGTCPNGHRAYRAQRSDKMFRTSCGKCDPRFNIAYMYEWKAQW